MSRRYRALCLAAFFIFLFGLSVLCVVSVVFSRSDRKTAQAESIALPNGVEDIEKYLVYYPGQYPWFIKLPIVTGRYFNGDVIDYFVLIPVDPETYEYNEKFGGILFFGTAGWGSNQPTYTSFMIYQNDSQITDLGSKVGFSIGYGQVFSDILTLTREVWRLAVTVETYSASLDGGSGIYSGEGQSIRVKFFTDGSQTSGSVTGFNLYFKMPSLSKVSSSTKAVYKVYDNQSSQSFVQSIGPNTPGIVILTDMYLYGGYLNEYSEIVYTPDQYRQYGQSQYEVGKAQGYAEGYEIGSADGGALSGTVREFIFALFDAPVSTFLSVFNLEYEGFDFMAFVTLLLSVIIIGAVVRYLI